MGIEAKKRNERNGKQYLKWRRKRIVRETTHHVGENAHEASTMEESGGMSHRFEFV